MPSSESDDGDICELFPAMGLKDAGKVKKEIGQSTTSLMRWKKAEEKKKQKEEETRKMLAVKKKKKKKKTKKVVNGWEMDMTEEEYVAEWKKVMEEWSEFKGSIEERMKQDYDENGRRKTPYVGVFSTVLGRMFAGQVKHPDGNWEHLGTYKTPWLAAVAHDQAALRIYGWKNAPMLNFPHRVRLEPPPLVLPGMVLPPPSDFRGGSSIGTSPLASPGLPLIEPLLPSVETEDYGCR